MTIFIIQCIARDKNITSRLGSDYSWGIGNMNENVWYILEGKLDNIW